jgi:hypothetical protein
VIGKYGRRPLDETELTDQMKNDWEGSGTDVEFGHGDINMTAILTIKETNQYQDAESKNNDE